MRNIFETTCSGDKHPSQPDGWEKLQCEIRRETQQKIMLVMWSVTTCVSLPKHPQEKRTLKSSQQVSGTAIQPQSQSFLKNVRWDLSRSKLEVLRTHGQVLSRMTTYTLETFWNDFLPFVRWLFRKCLRWRLCWCASIWPKMDTTRTARSTPSSLKI